MTHDELLATPGPLRAWLEGRGATGIYDPRIPHTCVLARFLQDHGYPHASIWVTVYIIDGKSVPMPKWMYNYNDALLSPYTEPAINGEQARALLLRTLGEVAQ